MGESLPTGSLSTTYRDSDRWVGAWRLFSIIGQISPLRNATHCSGRNDTGEKEFGIVLKRRLDPCLLHAGIRAGGAKHRDEKLRFFASLRCAQNDRKMVCGAHPTDEILHFALLRSEWQSPTVAGQTNKENPGYAKVCFSIDPPNKFEGLKTMTIPDGAGS